MTLTLEDLRAGDLSTDELAHLLANRRARESAAPPPALEWEQRPRTVEDRTFRFAQWARSWGAPEDLLACDLAGKLLRLGYSDDEAAEVLRDAGVAWMPSRSES
jgi:hypothetical protein